MKKAFLFLLVGLFISCSKSNDIEEKETVALIIENEQYNISSDKITVNENCNFIFANIKYYQGNNPSFMINFELYKNGVVKKVTLVDFKNTVGDYATADFIPTSTFLISNFSYDSNTNNLYFDFEGDLIKFNSNNSTIDIPSERKFLKGKIDSKKVIQTNCNSYFSNLNFNASNFVFNTNLTTGVYSSSLITNPFTYCFYSENGSKLSFKNSEKLFDLPVSQYDFDENTIENRINFEKFIGNIRATNLHYSTATDWKNYETNGNYKILEHKIVNGKNVTVGELNLNIYDNGNLLYEIKDAPFEVVF